MSSGPGQTGRGDEEATSMAASDPEESPAVPPDLGELEMERGVVDLYTGTESPEGREADARTEPEPGAGRDT